MDSFYIPHYNTENRERLHSSLHPSFLKIAPKADKEIISKMIYDVLELIPNEILCLIELNKEEVFTDIIRYRSIFNDKYKSGFVLGFGLGGFYYDKTILKLNFFFLKGDNAIHKVFKEVDLTEEYDPESYKAYRQIKDEDLQEIKDLF